MTNVIKASNRNFYTLCAALAIENESLSKTEIEAKATTLSLFQVNEASAKITRYEKATCLLTKMDKIEKIKGLVNASDISIDLDIEDKIKPSVNSESLHYLLRYGLVIEIRPGMYKTTKSFNLA